MTVASPARTDDVIGVGVDVVDIADFERVSFESNPAFYRRCFSESEIAYCRSRGFPARHFAVRFAAKEAAVKAASALVTVLPWDFEVERDRNGRPSLRLRHTIDAATRSLLEGHQVHVSLSHGETVAAAFVALCRVPPPA